MLGGGRRVAFIHHMTQWKHVRPPRFHKQHHALTSSFPHASLLRPSWSPSSSFSTFAHARHPSMGQCLEFHAAWAPIAATKLRYLFSNFNTYSHQTHHASKRHDDIYQSLNNPSSFPISPLQLLSNNHMHHLFQHNFFNNRHFNHSHYHLSMLFNHKNYYNYQHNSKVSPPAWQVMMRMIMSYCMNLFKQSKCMFGGALRVSSRSRVLMSSPLISTCVNWISSDSDDNDLDVDSDTSSNSNSRHATSTSSESSPVHTAPRRIGLHASSGSLHGSSFAAASTRASSLISRRRSMLHTQHGNNACMRRSTHSSPQHKQHTTLPKHLISKPINIPCNISRVKTTQFSGSAGSAPNSFKSLTPNSLGTPTIMTSNSGNGNGNSNSSSTSASNNLIQDKMFARLTEHFGWINDDASGVVGSQDDSVASTNSSTATYEPFNDGTISPLPQHDAAFTWCNNVNCGVDMSDAQVAAMIASEDYQYFSSKVHDGKLVIRQHDLSSLSRAKALGYLLSNNTCITHLRFHGIDFETCDLMPRIQQGMRSAYVKHQKHKQAIDHEKDDSNRNFNPGWGVKIKPKSTKQSCSCDNNNSAATVGSVEQELLNINSNLKSISFIDNNLGVTPLTHVNTSKDGASSSSTFSSTFSTSFHDQLCVSDSSSSIGSSTSAVSMSTLPSSINNSGPPLTQSQSPGLNAVISMLLCCELLESVNIERNCLNDSHIDQISQLLFKSKQLKRLSLCWNAFSAVGATQLTYILKKVAMKSQLNSAADAASSASAASSPQIDNADTPSSSVPILQYLDLSYNFISQHTHGDLHAAASPFVTLKLNHNTSPPPHLYSTSYLNTIKSKAIATQ